MTTATVSKLKASLSEYLRRVKAGEEVLVSERGRSIAKLVPVTGADALPDHLAEMARQGLVRVGSRRLSRAFWSLPRPRDPKASVRRALLEERATQVRLDRSPLDYAFGGRTHELRLLSGSEGPARSGAEVPGRAGLVHPGPPHSRHRDALRCRALAGHGGDGVDGHRDPRELRGRGIRLSRALRARRGARALGRAGAVLLDDLPRRRGALAGRVGGAEAPLAAPDRGRRGHRLPRAGRGSPGADAGVADHPGRRTACSMGRRRPWSTGTWRTSPSSRRAMAGPCRCSSWTCAARA